MAGLILDDLPPDARMLADKTRDTDRIRDAAPTSLDMMEIGSIVDPII